MASSPARVLGDQPPVALPADLPAHLSASLVTDLDEGDAATTSSLAAALAAVPDMRHRRGRRHELSGMLAIGACACLTGTAAVAGDPAGDGLRYRCGEVQPGTIGHSGLPGKRRSDFGETIFAPRARALLLNSGCDQRRHQSSSQSW